ncbi:MULTISPECIES: hypothetical protein [unclassified Roseovarius]|uniref:hypothetical protein n=1 Tax=unclassified Roseovarius TaxID=2614913 RepID=UPI00274020AA|nr:MULTISPECIES: hypothetical protein [unclassified Roseovarius]
MLLLAGLMGVLAIGATALVWFETSSRRRADQDADTPHPSPTEAENKTVEDTADGGDEDLIELAADLAEAVPMTPPATHVHEMDDPFMGGGWLLDDEDEDDDTADDDVVGSVGTIGVVNDTPVFFDAALSEELAETTETEEAASDTLHPALMQQHQENVADFLPDRDRLVVVFDDTADPDPELGVETDGVSSHVTLNGVRIATVDVSEGLTLEHIALVPESGLHGQDYATTESAAA